jgi:uncharacterized membrane protein YfcA
MLEWTVLIVSALIVGVSKAGFGSGVGILAVPLMTLAIGADRMLGVLLPVLILGDVLSLIHYLRDFDRRNLAMLASGCLAGVAAGAASLEWFRKLPDGDTILAAGIGALCVLFVGMQAALVLRRSRAGKRDPGGPEPPAYTPAVWHGLLVGFAAGLTSTLSHAAGPIVAMFLLPQRLGKRRFVGTMVMYFLLGNLMKLGPYLWSGVITASTMSYLPYLAPAVLAGTLVGVFLNRRLPARTFNLVIYVLVLATGLRLVAKAFGV